MFIQADLSALKEVSEVYLSETLQRYKVKKLGSTRLSISVSNGMISAHFSKENELTPEEYALILEAYKTKKNFVLLKDKVIMLDNEKVKELSDFVEDFNLNVKNLGKEAISPMYNMFKIEAYTELNVDIEDKVQDILNEIKNYKTSLYTPLDKFTQIMREYQVEGYKWLKILYNNNLSGILADDMGLGKSLQILSLIEEIKTNQPILIVCPKSLVYNWQNEFKKFHIQTPCLALIGTKKDREKIITMNQGRKIVLITSYDTLVRDIDQYIYVNFEMLLLDEAQNIKNMNSMRAKEVKKVQENHKFVLTGTPIENAISDLWSIFDFLMPKYLYSYERFKGIERRATEFDANELEFIVKKTRPFILRRTKKEVLKDLPDKIEEIVYTEFEDKNRLLYDAVLSQAQELLKITEKGKVFTILPYITKLRELCISPAMLYDGKYDSEKIELAAGLINEAISNKHKVLIFSSFVKSLTLLSDELTKQNIKYLKIIGDTNVKTRQENVDIINDPNREESVLLISLKAGGTGLNITGADIVIHLDPWWNVAAENQATDRAHRIGQKNTVYVYKIVIKDTIEDRVIELQQAKSDLIDKLILADEKGVGTISIDDYSFLLK
jgi:SNF2 family DNA or RNA helicase